MGALSASDAAVSPGPPAPRVGRHHGAHHLGHGGPVAVILSLDREPESPQMTFLPDPAVLAAYTLACFVLFVTPGPDMSLFLARTLSGGRRAGLAAMLGAMAGCSVHTLLAALGLSALLAASATAFGVLKTVGALYLLWLAFAAVRHGSALDVAPGRAGTVPLWRTFWLGVGVNLTNPKVVLFFVTF